MSREICRHDVVGEERIVTALRCDNTRDAAVLPPGAPSGGNESDIAEDVATRRVLSCALLGSCYRISFALAFGDDDASWTRSIGEEGGYDAAVRWMRDSATKFLLSR